MQRTTTPRCRTNRHPSDALICASLQGHIDPRYCSSCEQTDGDNFHRHHGACATITIDMLHQLFENDSFSKCLLAIKQDNQLMVQEINYIKDVPDELLSLYVHHTQSLKQKLSPSDQFSRVCGLVINGALASLTCRDIGMLKQESEQMEDRIALVEQFRDYVKTQTLEYLRHIIKPIEVLVRDLKIWSRLQKIPKTSDLIKLTSVTTLETQFPNEIYFQASVAEQLIQMGEHALAKETAQRCLQIDCRFNFVHFLLGLIQLRRKGDSGPNLDQALRHFLITMKTQQNFLIYFFRGCLDACLEEYEKAEEYLMQSIGLTEFSRQNFQIMANVCLETGRFEVAINYFSQLIEQDTEYVRSWYEQRAKLYQKLGRLEEARVDRDIIEKQKAKSQGSEKL